MKSEKSVVHNGVTFTVKNIEPVLSDTDKKLILQNIADTLSDVFRRNS